MKGLINMSKIINKVNYKKIGIGDEGYSDLSEFTEVSAEVSRKGEIGITDSDGSKRVRISSNLFSALEEPVSLKLLMSETKVAFKSVPEGTPGAYVVGKGAVIYSTDLAEKIITLVPDVNFKENATTRCGRIEQVQNDENGAVTVILNFD